MHEINMGKTPKQVMKDTKRQEAVQKGSEKYMNKLKQSTSKEAKKAVKILAMQAMVLLMPPSVLPALLVMPPVVTISMALMEFLRYPQVIVFIACNQKSSQTVNKEQVKEQPKRPSVL